MKHQRHWACSTRALLSTLSVIGLPLLSAGCGSSGSAASTDGEPHASPDPAGAPGSASAAPSASPEVTAGAPGSSSPSPGATQPELIAEMGESGCERVVSFEAVALSEPPPFDVVIVADHSGSVSWSRDELAAGLGSLLDDAFGRDLRVFVLTPTQFGASSAEAVDFFSGEPLVEWQDPESGQAYQHEMTRYSVECVDAEGASISCPEPGFGEQVFTATGTWTFSMPEPIALITKDMTAAEVAAQSELLVEGIAALGETGSPNEQPLCTLNRYIRQAPEALPEHVIFIVLSDEDDTSNPRDCLVDYTADAVAIDTIAPSPGCTSNCDRYQYSAEAVGAERKLTFDCALVDDLGNPLPDPAVPSELFLPSTETCREAVAECTTGDLAGAEFVCGEAKIQNCQKLCTEGSSSRLCHLWLESEEDACTGAFTFEGTTYANMAEYCAATEGGTDWTECAREGYTNERHVGISRSTYARPILSAGSQLAMVRSFQALAEAAFGEGGFFVESIVFDPRFSCELGPGQSYATDLSAVSTSPDDVFPICEPYAPALARAQEFATALLQTEYPLQLEPTEAIQSVTVTGKDEQTRMLGEGDFNHDVDRGTLHIEPGALAASDVSLSVELLDPCVRRVK